MGIRHALEFMDDLMENDMLTAEYINKYVMKAYNMPVFLPEEYEAMQDMFDKDIADYWQRQMEGIEEPEDIPVPDCIGRMLRYFMIKSGERMHGYTDDGPETAPFECYRCVESIIGPRGMKGLGIYEEMLAKMIDPLSYFHGRDTHAEERENNLYEDRGYRTGVSRNNNRSDPFAESFPSLPEEMQVARDPFTEVPNMGNYKRFEAYDPFMEPFPNMKVYESV